MISGKIEGLVQKYYEGETSLDEENELRDLLKLVEGFEEEKLFFLGLEEIKGLEPISRSFPKPLRWMDHWVKVAAVMLFFIGLSWMILDQKQKSEEALAYAQVMDAFTLIQENMQKGTSTLGVIQEMRHLGKTNEIFNIEEKEE